MQAKLTKQISPLVFEGKAGDKVLPEINCPITRTEPPQVGETVEVLQTAARKLTITKNNQPVTVERPGIWHIASETRLAKLAEQNSKRNSR